MKLKIKKINKKQKKKIQKIQDDLVSKKYHLINLRKKKKKNLKKKRRKKRMMKKISEGACFSLRLAECSARF